MHMRRLSILIAALFVIGGGWLVFPNQAKNGMEEQIEEATTTSPSFTSEAPTDSATSTASTTTTPQVRSGISGFLRTYGCPAMREGDPCGHPYATDQVYILTESGRLVARAASGIDGTFRVALPPGIYVVEVRNPPGIRPEDQRQTIRVMSGQYADVTFVFDSGVR
jgi:hypothetical protein